MKRLLIILALIPSPSTHQAETLPPEELLAPWSEWEDFATWQIKAFKGWDIPFDGGSKVFFFQSSLDDRFDVMAANPAYWTAEEKKERKQVFSVIRQNRFYRVISGSQKEAALIKMIENARPRLEGEGKTDPKLLDGLVERLRDRRAMFTPQG